MKTGAELISEEREEQLRKHEWDASHDDDHYGGALRVVAATLCVVHTNAEVEDPSGRGSGENPWGLETKLAYNDIHRLKVAGALIAAEIDRIQRLK